MAPQACVFCDVLAGRRSARFVFQHADAAAFLDHRPLFPGHCLVVPRPHRATLEELSGAELATLFAAVQRLVGVVERALEAEGTFVALNNRVSQSVPHVHVHVVPRRRGDGLKGFFWPRQGYRDERHEQQVHEQLRAAWERT